MTRLLPSPRVLAVAALAAFSVTGCMAPRAITSSGKVTPQGEFRAGGTISFNLPTETIAKTGSAVEEAANQLSRQDKVQYSELVDKLQVAALAYVIDPVQPASDLYLRYGALPRLDVGYKYAFGSHVFDAAYQFLGTTGTPESPGGAAGGLYGSIGLQFATQRAKLPSIPYLDNLNSLLRFSASRKDLVVPLIFSKSFGPEEEIGALAFGAVYTRTFMRYGFDPRNIYQEGSSTNLLPTLPTQKNNFSSYGLFANVKLGYRFAYVVPAFAVYYQNYGTYTLLNNKTAELKGLTFLPSIGLQLRIPKFTK